MIIEFLANSNPMNLSGMSSRFQANAIAFSQDDIESEFCQCEDECYWEYAFWDSSDSEHKNDKTSFLVRRSTANETWAIKLIKDDEVLGSVSATYGDYYDFGDLLYPDLKGILIDWKMVYNTHGNGNYKVRIEKTFGGTTYTKDSHEYRVRPYLADAANGTVKIESVQNGTFIGSGWTYRDLEWYQSVRVNGKFHNKKPTVEVMEYIDSDRNRNQVWDKVVTKYTLELRYIPNFIANQVLYDQILGNELYITDYNQYSHEVYRKKPIRLIDIPTSKYYQKSTRGSFEITVTDKSEGTIKGY